MSKVELGISVTGFTKGKLFLRWGVRNQPWIVNYSKAMSLKTKSYTIDIDEDNIYRVELWQSDDGKHLNALIAIYDFVPDKLMPKKSKVKIDLGVQAEILIHNICSKN